MSSELLTAKEVGKKLRVSEFRVYDAVRRGIIPPGLVIHIGRQQRFSSSALAEWLKNGGSRLAGGWRRKAKATK